jgi:hypothetical protein
MHTTKHTNPILAELAAAQQKGNVFGFDSGTEQREIARLQATYAAKCAQVEASLQLFEQTPAIALRAPDGREIVLHMSKEALNEVYTAVRDYLEEDLHNLERRIVGLHLQAEEQAALYAKHPSKEPDYAPAILALCMPAQINVTKDIEEVQPITLPISGPGNSKGTLPLPAGQRLFVTPGTKRTAAIDS